MTTRTERETERGNERGNDYESGKFYERNVPDAEELVMCKIIEGDDLGYTCSLLEYDSLEGYLAFTEITRKNTASKVSRMFKIGSNEVFQVVRAEGTHVDLTRKFLKEVDREEGKRKYSHGKFIYNVIKRVADQSGETHESLMNALVFPHEDPLDYFKYIAGENSISSEINEKAKTELLAILRRKFIKEPQKFLRLADITCFSDYGIDGIKMAANTVKNLVPGVSVKVYKLPVFEVSCVAVEESDALKKIDLYLETLSIEIKKYGGKCKLSETVDE